MLDDVYAYDADGNVAGITDGFGGIGTRSMNYDGLGRLISVSAPAMWGNAVYTYDPLDNLRTSAVGSRNYSSTYDAAKNRLVSLQSSTSPSITYAYDALGNVTQRGSQAFVFDRANRLTAATGKESYTYDGWGRRVSVTNTASGARRYMLYSQGGQLRYESSTDKTGALTTTEYVYLGGTLVGRQDSTAPVDPPAAPASLTVSPSPANGAYAVTWLASTGATSYELGLLPGTTNTWQPLYAGSALTFAVADPDGGTYRLRVRACTGTTCGDWTYSNYHGVTPRMPAVTAPATAQGSYRVTWSAPASATGYTVEEQVNGGTWARLLTGTTALGIDRPGNVPGSYVYRVQASNEYGTRGWAYSTAVTVVPAVPEAPVLSAPTPNPSTTGSYSLSWAAVGRATAYVLSEQANGGSWVDEAPTTDTLRAYVNVANGSYAYRVQACNAAGCSVWSNVVTASVAQPVAPGAPPSLSVAPNPSPDGHYTVAWPPVTGATSYVLYERANGSAPQVIGLSTPTATAASFTNRADATYTYTVLACSSGGCSAPSASVEAVVAHTTGLPAPATVSGPTTALRSGTAFNVLWSSVAGASRYEVQETALLDTPVATVYGTTATLMGFTRTTRDTAEFEYRVRACDANGCSPWSAMWAHVTIDNGTQRAQGYSTVASYYHTDALGSPVAVTGATGQLTSRRRYEPYGAPADGSYADGPGYTGHVTDAATGLTYIRCAVIPSRPPGRPPPAGSVRARRAGRGGSAAAVRSSGHWPAGIPAVPSRRAR